MSVTINRICNISNVTINLKKIYINDINKNDNNNNNYSIQIISVNMGKTIINHSPVVTIFMRGMLPPFSVMGGKNGIVLPTLSKLQRFQCFCRFRALNF